MRFARGKLCFLFYRAEVEDLQKDTRCVQVAATTCTGIPATGQDPVPPPGDTDGEEAAPGPFLLCQHRRCRMFILTGPGVITQTSKTSSTNITSVNTSQQERGPKHLFVHFHCSTSLREVPGPEAQAPAEEEASCTPGTSLVPVPDRAGSTWSLHHQKSAADRHLHRGARSARADLPCGTRRQRQPRQ